MCGIFAVSFGEGGQSARDVARFLMYMNHERGSDATGLVCHETHKDKTVWDRFRTVKSARECLISEKAIPAKFWDSPVIVGHARGASAGTDKSSSKSAHPFRFGDTIGAHNGFFSNWQEVAREFKSEIGTVNVDSEVAIFLINKFGIDGLSRLSGKGAIWWVKAGDPWTLNLWSQDKELAARLDEMPFIMSSDIKHLKVLANSGKIGNFKEEGEAVTVDLKTATAKSAGVVKLREVAKVIYTPTENSSSNYYGGASNRCGKDMITRLDANNIYRVTFDRSLVTKSTCERWGVSSDFLIMAASALSDSIGYCRSCATIIAYPPSGKRLPPTICPKCNGSAFSLFHDERLCVINRFIKALTKEELEWIQGNAKKIVAEFSESFKWGTTDAEKNDLVLACVRASTPATGNDNVLLFTVGPLERNGENPLSSVFPDGRVSFVGRAQTTKEFPLYKDPNNEWRLSDEAGNGFKVYGDLWKISKKLLTDLDESLQTMYLDEIFVDGFTPGSRQEKVFVFFDATTPSGSEAFYSFANT